MSELMAAERRREADMAREQYITRLESDVEVLREALDEIAELNPLSIAGGLDSDGLILTNAFLTARSKAREALSRISGEDRHG